MAEALIRKARTLRLAEITEIQKVWDSQKLAPKDNSGKTEEEYYTALRNARDKRYLA